MKFIARAIAIIRRVVMRYWWAKMYEESLNRRAEVEQELLDASRGKRPMPNQVQLRKWAMRLGVPDEWRAK